jgi:type II secretory pathway pseudopilin PulG
MKNTRVKRNRREEAGISLIETVIALGILLIVSVGILSMTVLSITTTENQGHLGARTAEYAQDKMEQLLSLSFTDTQTDTSVASFVANSSAGSPGLTAGGSITYGSPLTGYVDYLDASGNPLGGGTNAPAGWYYIRMWQITDVSTSLKRVDVQVWARMGSNGTKILPQSGVSALKSSPF